MTHFTCKACGGPFSRRPGDLRSYVAKFGRPPLYCSVPCSAVGRRTDAEARTEIDCIQCGKPVTVKRNPNGTLKQGRVLCSTKCRSQFRSERSPTGFVDGEPTTRHPKRNGYMWISIPAFLSPTGKKTEMLEHRYVMEKMLGRPMTSEETVHHRNGRKHDNSPVNLSLRSGRHGPGGDVSAMIRWAHEFIALYPQFDREGNFTPVDGSVAGHDQ